MHRSNQLYFLVVGAILILMACTPHYISPTFDTSTREHQIVAVLPFEMVYTGTLPDNISESELLQLQEAESKAFMISYNQEILRSTKSGRKPIWVRLQSYNKTLKSIESNGISLNEVWSMDEQELANLLGVDAVIKGRIEKYRIMSDLASFGIDVGVHILGQVISHGHWPWVPFHVTKSKEIKAHYSLIDRKEGEVIWSIAYNIDADWREPANEIIKGVNRRSARRFPYRS